MTRPDDECPYPRPFPPDFDSCPAYQARQFIPLNTMYQPLDPVLTWQLVRAAGSEAAGRESLTSAFARFGLAGEALQ